MKQMNSKKAKKVSSIQKLLQQHKQKFTTLQNGKIKCILTGHEFMPSVQNFEGHLKSKSYKKAIQAQFDISEYEKVLQTHKQNKNFLFCRLTGAKIPKKKTAIQKHVSCKRFQTRFLQYLQKMGDVSQQLQNQQQDIEEEQQQIEEDDVENQQQNQSDQQQDQQEQESQQSQQIKNKNKKNNGKNQKNGKNNKEQPKNKQINKKNKNKKNNSNKNGNKNNQKRK